MKKLLCICWLIQSISFSFVILAMDRWAYLGGLAFYQSRTTVTDVGNKCPDYNDQFWKPARGNAPPSDEMILHNTLVIVVTGQPYEPGVIEKLCGMKKCDVKESARMALHQLLEQKEHEIDERAVAELLCVNPEMLNAGHGVSHTTSLHSAARNGHVAAVRALLAAPTIKVNKLNFFFQKPLHLAAQ